MKPSMDTEAVAFPALIVAEDGWVDYLDNAARVSAWTTTAINKYNKCRVLLYDQSDRAWLVESIVPRDRRNSFVRLLHTASNPKLAVQMHLRPITDNPIGAIQEMLSIAIDNDDDILTQHTEAPQLKAAIQMATSFQAIVQVLRNARAI
jgi:hypothetical protein